MKRKVMKKPSHIFTEFVFTTLSLSWPMMTPDYTMAEDADLTDIIPGHDTYIVSSPNPIRQQLVQEALDALTEGTLVKTDEIKDAASKLELIEEENTDEQLCKELRNSIREERKESFKNGNNKPVRRLDTNCDFDAHDLRIFATPNDPMYSNLWGFQRMQMPTVWNSVTGSDQVVVAVVDTGIDYTHPDLAQNMWVNTGEVVGNGLDDDANGVVDDIYGYNAIKNSGDPMDDQSHGTHCAGTIGARGNNSIGVAGINWNVKILAAKFMNNKGEGSLWDAIKALSYIRERKVSGENIVATNNSWGGGGYMKAMEDEIRRHRDLSILFIAAAGNSNQNMDLDASYPASYQLENVIAVAAIDQNGSRAYFSNYGATSVHIAAPGVNIASTVPGNSYAFYKGTSMAAPHVAGAVALMKSSSFGLSMSELKNALLNNASYNQSLNGLVIGGRELNLLTTIQKIPNNPPGIPPPAPQPKPTNTPTPIPSPTPTLTPTSTPIPQSGILNITITDEQGTRISGASISIKTPGSNTVSWNGTTGSDGKILSSGLSGGLYQVILTKSGYSFDEGTQIFVNGDTSKVFIARQSTYLYQGTVIRRTDAEPIVGASVKYYVNGSYSGEVLTDSNGKFSKQIPYGVRVKIVVNNEDFNVFESEIEKLLGKITREVALIPG